MDATGGVDRREVLRRSGLGMGIAGLTALGLVRPTSAQAAPSGQSRVAQLEAIDDQLKQIQARLGRLADTAVDPPDTRPAETERFRRIAVTSDQISDTATRAAGGAGGVDSPSGAG